MVFDLTYYLIQNLIQWMNHLKSKRTKPGFNP